MTNRHRRLGLIAVAAVAAAIAIAPVAYAQNGSAALIGPISAGQAGSGSGPGTTDAATATSPTSATPTGGATAETPGTAPAYVPGDGGYAHADAVPGSGSGHQSLTTQAVPPGYTVKGVDVSSNQGNVDWASVAAAGNAFAYVKATEGTTYTNPYFNQQYQGAKAAGLLAGAYAFARPDAPDNVAQADYLASHAQYAADHKSLPLMLDLEGPYGGIAHNLCWDLNPTQMVTWIRGFVDEIHRRVRKQVLIYTGLNWWTTCTAANTTFTGEYLFFAHYQPTIGPLPGGWATWQFWQYGDVGTDGDHDVFNGTQAQLAALTEVKLPEAPPPPVPTRRDPSGAPPPGSPPPRRTGGATP